MKPTYLTDKNGRRYPVYVCVRGHWHRGLVQAQRCNAQARQHGLVERKVAGSFQKDSDSPSNFREIEEGEGR